jgi:Holliday junction resolvase
MKESNLERKLKREVERQGGKALKFVSPGTAGVPDRLVLLPGGRLFFVEVKAPGQKLRPIQEKRKRELENLGFKVYVMDSLDDFIKEVFS